MMCRMPYTLFTVVLNAMFLLLMPLGMVLIGGAADGWAVLADLVFYIFFAPQLAFMMERLMYPPKKDPVGIRPLRTHHLIPPPVQSF